MTIIRDDTKLRRTIAAKSLSEQELSEHSAQVDAENEAAEKGQQAESRPKVTKRDTLVARIKTEIGQALPDKFHSGPLPVKANLFCAECGYDVNKSLYVVIEKDLSARWECHNSSCDLDGHIGKRHGKPAVGPEAVLACDDDDQRRFARHYLYAGLPDVLRKRMLFEEDVEFDAGPDEPILFLKNYISFMLHDKAARKYWNRALKRYTQDLFTRGKAMGRSGIKISGRTWPPMYISNDRTIMSRASTCKMIEEVYPLLKDQKWTAHDSFEWHVQNRGWQPPDEYDNIIAPILVTLNAEKTANALDISPDELWAYMRAMESTGLTQRVALLKHGRRLWSLGYWQQSENMRQPRPLWFLKNEPELLVRLRAVQVWNQN